MATIEWTTDGNLPEGIHALPWTEFAQRFGFSPRRRAILGRVVYALHHLAQAGVTRVFIGGSFVTTKKSPKDMDILIDTTGADVRRVHQMFVDISPAGRLTTLSLFGAEFFPTWLVEGKSDLTMLEFFQQNRDGIAVGLIEIDLGVLPPTERRP